MGEGASALPVLELADLTVRRGGVASIERVSLTVAAGSVHAIVGPNGAGKSTLVAALLGLVPFEGSVRYHFCGDGRIGYVPQRFEVDATLPITVRDFLALGRQRAPVALGARRETRRAIDRTLERVGLAGFGDRLIGALSGGELQRVLLGNAIDPVPELLVLDEPATGLDAEATARFDAIVSSMSAAEGVAVVLVAHDLEQVRRISSRVTVLNRRVLAEGPPEEALAAMADLLRSRGAA